MCWDTRIRTWKNRTRICCVTITPYPNFPIKTPVLILTLQRYGFLFNPQIFEAFFGSNIEYNPKFLGKIKKALKFQCLYRSFYFHWLKQSG